MMESTVGVVQHISGAEAFARHFAVSRETVQRLETYAALLAQWQQTINLVAPGTLADIWSRHFADSAQLFRLIPHGARRLVDLGSGAGFPGLVLAIMAGDDQRGGREGASSTAPSHGLRVTLVESDQRKAAFLREVSRKLGIAVDIELARIEIISTRVNVERFDVITSRALAPLPRLLEMSRPFFESATVALFLKGRDVESEVEDARKLWSFSLELVPSMTNAEARVAVIRDVRSNREG